MDIRNSVSFCSNELACLHLQERLHLTDFSPVAYDLVFMYEEEAT